MALAITISARVLFWAAWLLFYAQGCPDPWAWPIFAANIAAAVLLGRLDTIHPPSPWALIAFAGCGFQIYVWSKGWPKDLVTPLFWLTVVEGPASWIDEYFLRPTDRRG